VHDQQARELLEKRVREGGQLVVAQEADWAGIKRLQLRCHEAGIPSMLTGCPKGG
jgi:hypothetical protein